MVKSVNSQNQGVADVFSYVKSTTRFTRSLSSQQVEENLEGSRVQFLWYSQSAVKSFAGVLRQIIAEIQAKSWW